MEPLIASASINRQGIVDAVGDLSRALKVQDPATLPGGARDAVQELQGLFAVLFDAELADGLAGEPGLAVVEAEQAITGAAAGLLALVEGAALPDGLQELAGALQDRLQPVA